MRLLVALTLASLLLAGCAAPLEEPAATNETAGPVVFAEDYALGNETVPAAELTNATLGAEHIHDAWGEAEQLVLLDETIAAGDCEGPQDAVFYAGVTAFMGQGPAYGCARLSLPEGVVVPEGTGEMQIIVDASQALQNGEMVFQFRNKAREEQLEATSETEHTWILPLTQADWDIAHATATTFVMYVGALGPGALFEGPLPVRIVAMKAPGWEPILAVAHVDHWALPSLHDFAAPGVMRLLDAEMSVTNIDPARATGPEEHAGVALTDIIAPGASYLALVVDTVSSDCPPVVTCWMVPQLHVGGYERDRFGVLAHEEGQRRIYTWAVPDEVPEDSVYAEASTTEVEPRITACTPDGTCDLASIASTSITARVQAFSGNGELDVAALSALAG
jgi:hypothetical protein